MGTFGLADRATRRGSAEFFSIICNLIQLHTIRMHSRSGPAVSGLRYQRSSWSYAGSIQPSVFLCAQQLDATLHDMSLVAKCLSISGAPAGKEPCGAACEW